MKLKKADYLKVVGLLTLADSHRSHMNDIAKALAEITGEKADPGCNDYFGHVSDAVWSGYSADQLLSKLDAQRKRKQQ